MSHSSNTGEIMPKTARRNRRVANGTKPRAKRNGKGQITSIDPTRIQALKSRGLSADKIAAKLKISKSSVYRYARA
jgi:hypothetical protein